MLTEWSARGAGSDKSLGLKIVTQTAAMQYRIDATNGPQTILANVVNHFPIRIPVSGGELLALWVPSGLDMPCDYTGVPADITEYRGGDFPEPNIGDTFPTDVPQINTRSNVEARLEPDADCDGLGDETQDTNVSAAGCPAPPPQTTAQPKAKKCKKHKKKHRSAESAKKKKCKKKKHH